MAVSQTLSLTEVTGSVNIAANTSKVRIQWHSTQTGDSWNGYTRTAKYYVSINGGAEKEYAVNYNLPQNATKTILDTTITVAHRDDGSGSVRVRTAMETGISAGVVELSETLTLTTIPRASTINSVSNVIIGNRCNVKWTPMSSTLFYKLGFQIGDWKHSSEVVHPNGTKEYAYTGLVIPMEVANQIPNGATGNMYVYLHTFSDSAGTVQIGNTASAVFAVTVPDNEDTRPDVGMTLTPVSSLPDSFSGLYIQGKSKVRAAIAPKGRYEAGIVSSFVNVGGSQYGAEEDYTSDHLNTYGQLKVTGYATDSRGYTGSSEQSITVIPYLRPQIQNVTAERCEQDGTLSESGTYLKISAKRVYAKVMSDNVQKNFCQIRYRCKVEGGQNGEWVTILASDAADDTVTTEALMNGSLAITNTYIVEVQAIDDVGEHGDATVTVPTERVYDHEAGSIGSYGFGKYVTDQNTFDIAEEKTFRARGKVVIDKTPVDEHDAANKGFVEAVAGEVYNYGIGSAVWVEWADVDSIKAPGWYRSQPTSGTSLGGIAWSAAVWFRVDGYDKNACCQTFYLASADGFIVRRQCNGGVWGAFECVNPPMHNGADYRTTERHRGAAVYKRLITMNLTSNNVDTISHGITGTIIGIHCIVHRPSDNAYFELSYQASSTQVCCYLIGSIFYILHNGSCNGNTATITFKYVK